MPFSAKMIQLMHIFQQPSISAFTLEPWTNAILAPSPQPADLASSESLMQFSTDMTNSSVSQPFATICFLHNKEADGIFVTKDLGLELDRSASK